jgi:ribosomal-protein-alanine N-acetyltransferase
MRWPPRVSVEETEQAILRANERRRQATAFSWAMTLPVDDVPFGFIGLIPEGHMAELSYVLAQDAWGRGYASEAAGRVVEAALGLSGVFRIWAMCDVDNVPSARVLEKTGMQLEGTVRRYAVRPALGPEPRDAFLFARVR